MELQHYFKVIVTINGEKAPALCRRAFRYTRQSLVQECFKTTCFSALAKMSTSI